MYLVLASIDHCGQNSKMTQSGRLNFHNGLIDSLTTDFYFVFFSFPPMCIYIDSFPYIVITHQYEVYETRGHP